MGLRRRLALLIDPSIDNELAWGESSNRAAWRIYREQFDLGPTLGPRATVVLPAPKLDLTDEEWRAFSAQFNEPQE